MSGEVGHFEIPADQPERARKFYASAFGWRYNEMPGMDYTMVMTGPTDDKGMPKAPGFIGGGIAKRGAHLTHPVLTIIVEDIGASEKVIAKNGGKVLVKKQPIGDGTMGFTGYFQDSEGNVVGLYQAGKR
ncbi:MAG TPA: VOC family protein [Thermoplasmata archaeon]|nr:VOC family protein [Thermoplasmata archaeon]